MKFPLSSIRLSIAALLVFACLPGFASWFGKDKQDLPQWGLDAAKTPTPTYVKDAASVILFDEYLETVDAQGRAYATGKRKNAIARVWIKPGTGKITVNARDEKVYFARPVLRMILRQPLIAANRDGQFDVVVTVKGGDVNAFVNNDFMVNQSRVFTRAGRSRRRLHPFVGM